MGKKEVYARAAWYYDAFDFYWERKHYRRIRPTLFAGLTGRVLDAGVGTGRNIQYYEPAATVTGIDLSPAMLARAERRRAEALRAGAGRNGAGRNVELLEMNVMETTFADDTFDAIVSTFLFCVLDDHDQLPALKELARICKPTGEIRLVEYAYAQQPIPRLIMKLWTPLVHYLYGARFDRNTEQYADAAGLELVELRYLHADIIKLLVLRPRSGA